MKLGSKLFFATVGKVIQQAAIFALSIIFSRYFTKADYGNYLHVQLIVNICTWAFLLGIPHSIYYFLPNTGAKRHYMFQVFGIVLIVSTIVAFGLALLNGPISSLLSNPSLSQFVLVISLLTLFQIPAAIFEPFLIAAGRVGLYGICDIVFNMGFFAAVFIPVQLGKDVSYILHVLVMYYALQFVVMAIILVKLALGLGNEDGSETVSIKRQFGYSLPIGASQGMFELASYTDRLVISHYFSPGNFAEYTRGAMQIPMVGAVMIQLDNLLTGKLIGLFNANKIAELVALWHSAIRMIALLFYPLMAFFVFVAPLLIPALFSQKYVGSVIIFQIYTCTLLFRVTTYNVIVRVVGRTKILIWITVLSVVSNLVLTLWLVHVMGMAGAPFATVMSVGITSFAYIWVISRYLGIHLRTAFPWLNLLRILFHSLIGLFVLYPMFDLSLPVWPKLGLMLLVYVLVCWIQLKLFRVVPDDDKANIRSFLPARFSWLV